MIKIGVDLPSREVRTGTVTKIVPISIIDTPITWCLRPLWMASVFWSCAIIYFSLNRQVFWPSFDVEFFPVYILVK